MDGRYAELITRTSAVLAQGLLEDADGLIEVGHDLDQMVLELLRQVGLEAMGLLFQELSAVLVEKLSSPALPVERRPKVSFKVVFGELEVESPYLRNRTTSESRRPMLETFGVEGHAIAVESIGR